MKTLFIEAKHKEIVQLPSKIIEKLPKNIGIASSIQFIDSLKPVQDQLGNKSIIAGQILGCNATNADKIKGKVDAFLYIGDGQFHPMAIAIKTKKPVYRYNPFNKSLDEVQKTDIERYEKKRMGALSKFLNAKTIGVLTTTKSGQSVSDKRLKELENKYKDKNFYKFIADTIDYTQLENFPFIEAWVNTACPRIEEDISIVNIDQL